MDASATVAAMRAASVLASLVLLAGCEPRLSLGERCTSDRDCEAPYACRLGSCRAECTADVDCPIGVTCVPITADAGACTFEIEERCTPTICPAPLACRDGRCRATCTVDGECLASQRCSDGSCVAAPDADAGVPDDAGADVFVDPVLCTTAASCGPGSICDGDWPPSVCRAACTSHAECPEGSACDDYAAETDAGYVLGCSTVCRPGTSDGCPDGRTCRMIVRSEVVLPGEPHNITVCQGSVPGRVHGCPCEALDSADDCAAGFSCEQPEVGMRMCLRICALGTECAPGVDCVSTRRSVVLDHVEYGVCPPPPTAPIDCPSP